MGSLQDVSVGKITFAVITRNEERRIEGCLSGARWADEILVLDSYSADGTVGIARRYTDRVFQNEFISFPNQRNRALDLASGDWVLFVDADERVTPELAEEVQRVVRQAEASGTARLVNPLDVGTDGSARAPARMPEGDKNTPAESDFPAGYWIPRRNIIWGKWIKHGGWYPDYQLRLLRRDSARYDENRLVHELVVLQGPESRLSNTFLHYNYESVSQFLQKQRAYCQYESRTLLDRGVGARPWSPALQSLRAVKRRLWDLEGYRDGGHGLLLSLLLGYYEFVVYSRLLRMRSPT